MTDTDFWDSRRSGKSTATASAPSPSSSPPFRPYSRRTPASVAGFAPNDPARARAFAESFPTVMTVLERLPPTNTVPVFPWTRADLDLVGVGCWGTIVAISDYALADHGLEFPLLDATSALAERFPEARVFGAASVDCGENHVETSIHLPGGLRLYSEGWPAGDRYDLDGDPHAIVRALDIGPEVLAEEHIDLDGEAWTVPWRHFGDLLLWPYDPWGWEALEMSQFRVRHTEDATFHMEDIWFRSAEG